MRTIVIVLLTLLCSMLKSQQVVATAGDQFSNVNGSISFTIGEGIVNTFTSGEKTLTQGFHQIRLTSTAVDDRVTPGLSLAVFPNPFVFVLHLRVDEGDFSQLQYSWLTIEGKLLSNNKLTGNLTQIDLQTYASGSYLLRISLKNGEPVKAFKVVKQ